VGLKIGLSKNWNYLEIKKDGIVIGIIKVDPLGKFKDAKIDIAFKKEYEIRRVKVKNEAN
jgi:hypothetical protein